MVVDTYTLLFSCRDAKTWGCFTRKIEMKDFNQCKSEGDIWFKSKLPEGEKKTY